MISPKDTKSLQELADDMFTEELNILSNEPVILGIDPAIASIGFGVIQGNKAIDYGVITTKASDLIWQRLASIEEDIRALLNEHKPQRVAMEMPFFDRTNTNASKVGRALGIIHLVVGEYLKEDPEFLHQSQVKAAVARGGASKKEVQAAVMRLYGLAKLPEPDDAADGLAIAYAAQSGAVANIR